MRFDGTCLLNTKWMPVSGNGDRTLMGFLRTVSDNEPNPVTATQFFAGWGSPETTARIRFDLGFRNNSNAQLRSEYNAGFTLSAAAAEPLNFGRWHHFAVVWTAAGLAATFYLDGQPFGSAVANGTLSTGGGAVDIGLTLGADTRAAGRLSGASGQTPSRYFKGDLDRSGSTIMRFPRRKWLITSAQCSRPVPPLSFCSPTFRYRHRVRHGRCAFSSLLS